MAKSKVFINPYPEGWKNLPSNETPITAEALQAHTSAIDKMDDHLVDLSKAEDAGFILINLFDPSRATIGVKISDNGQNVEDPDYMISELIEIKPLQNYKISGFASAESVLSIHLYNENEEWIMLNSRFDVSEEFEQGFGTLPNSKYIRFSIGKDTSKIVISEGYVAQKWARSNVELTEITDELKESLIQYEQSGFLSRNLIPSFIVGKYIDGDRGTEMTSNLFSCTDFIKIDATNNYILSNANVNKFISVYDASKTYLGRTEAITNRNIILPSDYMSGFDVSKIAFCRITVQFPNANNNNVMFEEGTVAHDWTPYAKPNTELTQIVKDAEDRGFISKNIWSQNPIVIGASSGVSYNQPLKKGRYIIKADSNISASGVFNLYGYVSSLETLLSNISWADAKSGIEFETTKDYDLMRIYSSGAVNGNIMICNADFKDAPYQPYAPSNTELKQSLEQLKLEEINPTLSGNFGVSDLKAYKSANVVYISCTVTVSSNLTSNTALMTIPYKPVSSLHFCDIRNNYSPYANVGKSGFIRGSNGVFELPNGLSAGTYYVNATYICL